VTDTEILAKMGDLGGLIRGGKGAPPVEGLVLDSSGLLARPETIHRRRAYPSAAPQR
jgi:hypothetical protein